MSAGLAALPPAEWDTEVLIFSGAGRREVIDSARAWLDVLAGRPGAGLADLSRTLGRHLRRDGVRLGLVAATMPELASKIETAAELLADPTLHEVRDPRGIYYADRPLTAGGRLALIFPGDGSPYLNMMADLVALRPEVREWFEIADRVARENGRRPYSEVVFPGPLPSARERRRAEHALRRMEVSASAVLACNHGLYLLLRRLGIEPDALIGHSLGDWSALGAGGVTDVAQFLRSMDHLLHLPGHVTRAGARMALAIAERETVERVLAGVAGEVYVAMHNGPRRVVIAGAKSAVQRAVEALGSLGRPVYRLPFVRAAHTPMTVGLCGPMAEAFAVFGNVAPNVEVWSCTTARPYPPDPAEIRRIAVENMIRPVEFQRTIEHAWSAGIRLFIECGASGQLADCVSDILGDREHLAFACDLRQRRGITQLNHLLAATAAHGVAINLEPLFEHRSAELLEPPAREPEPVGPPVRRAAPRADSAVAGFLRHTSAALESHLAAVRETLSASTAFSQQAMAAQREVMLALYGAAPAAAAAPATPDISGYPFLDELVSFDAGRAAVLRHRLDPATQPYLMDHRIGGYATHDELTADPLPLVPATVTVEMMAEAGAVLCPGRPLRGIRRVTARRELSGEGAPTLEFRATTVGDGEVEVEVFDLSADPPASCADGLFLYGERPAPPEPMALPMTDPRPAPMTAEDLYGRHIMFHGPCFHGVSWIGPQAADSLTGRLRSLPRRMLLGGDTEPAMLTDPALLDAMGQLFGCWPLGRLEQDTVVFPAQIGSVEFFGPPPEPGDDVEVSLRIDELRPKRLVGTIDLSLHGRLWLRVERWTFWRFNWPPSVLRFLGYPDRFHASTSLAESFPALPLDGLGTGLFATRRSLELPTWLARVIVTRAEQAELLALPDAHRQQDQFLAGRIAAKDAVRRWLEPRGHGRIEPNRIGIAHDAAGRPQAVLRGELPTPAVSLAHKPGIAVAVAGEAPVGIDVELITERDEAFCKAAFSADELSRLTDTALRTSAWAAKEAAGKRAGTGLNDPRRWAAEPLGDGRYRVTGPSGAEEVTTAVSGDWVVALARG